MQQKNGISTTTRNRTPERSGFQEPQEQLLDQRVGGFWGPSRSTPFVRNNPLVFFRDPKKRNPITADGIFVGHTAYGMWGFILRKKKITSNKDVDSRSTIWGMLY